MKEESGRQVEEGATSQRRNHLKNGQEQYNSLLLFSFQVDDNGHRNCFLSLKMTVSPTNLSDLFSSALCWFFF